MHQPVARLDPFAQFRPPLGDDAGKRCAQVVPVQPAGLVGGLRFQPGQPVARHPYQCGAGVDLVLGQAAAFQQAPADVQPAARLRQVGLGLPHGGLRLLQGKPLQVAVQLQQQVPGRYPVADLDMQRLHQAGDRGRQFRPAGRCHAAAQGDRADDRRLAHLDHIHRRQPVLTGGRDGEGLDRKDQHGRAGGGLE